MSISEGYTLLANYGLYAAGLVIVLLMLKRFNTVAQSGNVKRMATETAAPGLMLIVAVAVSGAAIAYALPRINAFVQSEQIVAAVEAGGVLAGAADRALAPVEPGTMGDGLTFAQFPNGGTWGGNSGSIVLPAPALPSAGAMPTVEALPTVAINPADLNPVEVLPTATTFVKPTPISTEIQQVSGGHDYYIVQSGDSMFKIAERLLGRGSRYVELCAANIGTVGGSCRLTPGMKIIVPSDIQAYTPPTGNGGGVQTVVNRVQVAQPIATTVRRIQAAPTVVSRVPVAQPQPTAAPTVAANVYTIVAGDNVYSIAQKTGFQVYDLCVKNRAVLGDNCDNLTTGAVLVLP